MLITYWSLSSFPPLTSPLFASYLPCYLFLYLPLSLFIYLYLIKYPHNLFNPLSYSLLLLTFIFFASYLPCYLFFSKPTFYLSLCISLTLTIQPYSFLFIIPAKFHLSLSLSPSIYLSIYSSYLPCYLSITHPLSPSISLSLHLSLSLFINILLYIVSYIITNSSSSWWVNFNPDPQPALLHRKTTLKN